MIRKLIDAVEDDDEKTAKYWIGKGADVNGTVPGGWTAMHGATRKGHKEMLKFLISKGGDVNLATNKKMETPLHVAAFHDQLSCAKLLVKNGADLKAKTKQGRTPLDVAIVRNSEDVQDYLETKASKDAKKAKAKGKGKKKSSKKKGSSGGGLVLLIIPFFILLFLMILANVLV